MIKLKAPENVVGASVEGVPVEIVDGHVVVPPNFADVLASHGFVVAEDRPEAAKRAAPLRVRPVEAE